MLLPLDQELMPPLDQEPVLLLLPDQERTPLPLDQERTPLPPDQERTLLPPEDELIPGPHAYDNSSLCLFEL